MQTETGVVYRGAKKRIDNNDWQLCTKRYYTRPHFVKQQFPDTAVWDENEKAYITHNGYCYRVERSVLNWVADVN